MSASDEECNIQEIITQIDEEEEINMEEYMKFDDFYFKLKWDTINVTKDLIEFVKEIKFVNDYILFILDVSEFNCENIGQLLVWSSKKNIQVKRCYAKNGLNGNFYISIVESDKKFIYDGSFDLEETHNRKIEKKIYMNRSSQKRYDEFLQKELEIKINKILETRFDELKKEIKLTTDTIIFFLDNRFNELESKTQKSNVESSEVSDLLGLEDISIQSKKNELKSIFEECKKEYGMKDDITKLALSKYLESI